MVHLDQPPLLTLVVVHPVVAVLLEPDVAAGPVPAALAQTLPALLVVGHGAGAVTPAVAGAALQGAVLPIPAVGAQTRSVTAHSCNTASSHPCHVSSHVSLTVLRAPGVTGLHPTRVPIPALVTHTSPRLAVAVLATVQVTQLCIMMSVLPPAPHGHHHTHLCRMTRPCSPRDTGTGRPQCPRSRGRCSRADTASPRRPPRRRSRPSSPSCRRSSRRHRTRGRCSEGPHSQLETENTILVVKRERELFTDILFVFHAKLGL